MKNRVAQGFASVALPIPKFKRFHYGISSADAPKIQAGSIVQVSFGRKSSIGWVEEISSHAPVGDFEIKNIQSNFQELVLPPGLHRLLKWASHYYLTPAGEVFKSALPSSLIQGKLSKGARSRVIEFEPGFEKSIEIQLNKDQQQAFDEISKHFNQFYPVLLQGITGSGKTEVYLHLAKHCLAQKKSALILVPEIALTPQAIGRFREMLGNLIVPYHSNLSDAQRLKIWWQVYQGAPLVVVGTRSAVFLPFQNLGLIVVDEEQDASYKQEERFRYQGRDVAVMRAHLEKIPIVLGSATPCIETLYNVELGKYKIQRLKSRATMGVLPQVEIVDLTKVSWDQDSFLSAPLIEQLKVCLSRDEQAILFINRRGFANFLLCVQCGLAIHCPNCDVSLVYHRGQNLKCHYCELTYPRPDACPQCKKTELLLVGSGTQRIEDRLAELFPHARIARLDRDTMEKKGQGQKILADFLNRKIDVLVGTQLVIKGHDFPYLTLVGVLLADQSINMGDFRAHERTFQMLTQVAGRAGRHHLPGRVMIQTFNPEHSSIQYAVKQDPDHFYKSEKGYRQELSYPPFSKIILLRFSSNQREKACEISKKARLEIENFLKPSDRANLLGPAACIIERLRNKYRWQLMLKLHHWQAVHAKLMNWLIEFEEHLPSGVQMAVDVDPLNTL